MNAVEIQMASCKLPIARSSSAHLFVNIESKNVYKNLNMKFQSNLKPESQSGSLFCPYPSLLAIGHRFSIITKI